MVEQNLIEAIDQLSTGKLIDFSTLELDKITKEYPCFHSAYLIQAIALKQEREEIFQEQLPSLATRVLNRAVLYDRITNNYSNETINNLEEAIVDIEEEQNETNSLTTEKNAENNDLHEESEDIDDEVEAIINQSEVLTQENPILKTPEIEEENIKELIEEVKEKPKKQAIVTKVKKIIKEERVSKTEDKELENSKNISFTDWLKNKKSIDKVIEKQKIVKKTIEEIPLDMAASHEASLFMEAKKSSFKLEDFLVDQIERKQERKEHKKKDFTHAVSETYAKILVSQGKIQEAINVYKELSIKYPKKSSNFANQIEKLKNSL